MGRLWSSFAAVTPGFAVRHWAVVYGCVVILSVAACSTTVRPPQPPTVKAEPPPAKIEAPPVELEPPPVIEPAHQNRQSSIITFHGDAAGVDFRPWITEFVAHLKKNWQVPYASSSLTGHSAVAFRVHKDGRITDVVLERPSGVTSFDEASSRAVAACNPTLPLPSAYVREDAMFTVTFYYNEVPPKQEARGKEPDGSGSFWPQPNTALYPTPAGAIMSRRG